MRNSTASILFVVLACAAVAVAQQQEPSNPADVPAEGRLEAINVWSNLLDSRKFAVVTDHTINITAFPVNNALGVEVTPVDTALRSQLGLPEATGVVVTAVAADSAAAKAGIAQYDVVLKIDSDEVTSPEQFQQLLQARAGQEVRLHLLRQGKPQEAAVSVPKLPLYELALPRTLAVDIGRPTQHYRIGVTLVEADDTLRSQLRMAAGEGLVVTDVVDDSPAAKAGLRQHDVLTKVDGKRLTTVEAVNAQIQEIKDRAVTIVFFRNGQESTCEVAPKLTSEPNYAALERDALLHVWSVESRPHYHMDVRWADAIVNPKTSVADQLAALKEQMAQMQESIEALSAAIEADKK